MSKPLKCMKCDHRLLTTPTFSCRMYLTIPVEIAQSKVKCDFYLKKKLND